MIDSKKFAGLKAEFMVKEGSIFDRGHVAYPLPGQSTSWLKGGAVEQRTFPLELMGCGSWLCRVGGMADLRLHAADP